MKPKNVSVSLYQHGGELRVWCASFTLKGELPVKDGKTDEAAVRRKQREIEKVLESMEFSDA